MKDFSWGELIFQEFVGPQLVIAGDLCRLEAR